MTAAKAAHNSPAQSHNTFSEPHRLHATDVQAIHDALVADGHTIVSAPIDGPFGRTFTFADPDGYQVTLHDRA
jgi:predicted enzyme related to lactoylglutathione lyase